MSQLLLGKYCNVENGRKSTEKPKKEIEEKIMRHAYTAKKLAIFPARFSLVSDIPAGDGKIANLFYCVIMKRGDKNIFGGNRLTDKIKKYI